MKAQLFCAALPIGLWSAPAAGQLEPIITVEGQMPEDEAVAVAVAPPPALVFDPRIAEVVNDEIVITGENYGKARVDAESEFEEDAIAAHGADTIQQLLEKLTSWIDPSGEEPVLLINGEPAGFDKSILNYPPEALRRLEVLKPEAAVEYGQQAGKRVVNLVLKRQFAMLNGELGGNWATAGGQSGQKFGLNRNEIRGRTRWNASLRYSHDSSLAKHRRDVTPTAGVFDGDGFVSGVGGGEVDPALSALAGQLVGYVAFPRSVSATLGDFAANANRRDALDPSRYESLTPKRESLGLVLGVTRPIGSFNLSLNLNGNMSDTSSRRGLAMANYLWSHDHPLSPFSQPVRVHRPIAGLWSLHSDGKNRSLGGSISLNGQVAGWQTSLGLNFNQSWNETQIDNGVRTASLQAAINNLLLSPFDPIGEEWISTSRTKGKSRNVSGRASAQKSIYALPAGDVNLSLSANASTGSSQSVRWLNGVAFVPNRSSNERWNGQAAVSIPINREGEGLLPLVVAASVDVSATVQQSGGAGLQRSWTLGGSLEPITGIQLRGRLDRTDLAPTFQDVDVVTDEQWQRVFDYRRAEMVDVIWVTGGTPNLKRGRQQSLSLDAMIRPWGFNGPTFTLGYRRNEMLNGISALPELTPDVEVAFPERIIRDGEGRLLRIDARNINVKSQRNDSLNNGLSLRWPMGSAVGGDRGHWQFQASINHRMALSSERHIRSGLPVVDLLAGTSGQSRHQLSGQFTASTDGMGMTISGNWGSRGRLQWLENDPRGLIFTPPLLLNLATHFEPDRMWSGMKDSPILKGLRISLDVQNLTKSYRRVRRADGSIPPGYGRDDVDPMGQVVRLQLRKKF